MKDIAAVTLTANTKGSSTSLLKRGRVVAGVPNAFHSTSSVLIVRYSSLRTPSSPARARVHSAVAKLAGPKWCLGLSLDATATAGTAAAALLGTRTAPVLARESRVYRQCLECKNKKYNTKNNFETMILSLNYCYLRDGGQSGLFYQLFSHNRAHVHIVAIHLRDQIVEYVPRSASTQKTKW